MNEKKCCGTCRWHLREAHGFDPDWVCDNEDSRYYADYTGYDDVCPDWEGRK